MATILDPVILTPEDTKKMNGGHKMIRTKLWMRQTDEFSKKWSKRIIAIFNICSFVFSS